MCEDILVCLFGYGSILWRPGFPFVRKFNAYIKGYRRMFYQGSTDHRGTPEAPGRVVTLIKQPEEYTADDWITWGTVYCIPDEEAELILKNLDYREKGGYQRIEVDIFINGKDSPHGSVGPSGRNLDYLLKLAGSLRKMEVEDQHVFTLEQKVLELMQLHNIDGGGACGAVGSLVGGSGASSPMTPTTMDIASETIALQKKYFVQPKGSIVIDDGAMQAISQRAKSLLAVGITAVVGDFEATSLVSIRDVNNCEISRAKSWDSVEVKQL
eukprot:gene14170-16702_t